MWKILNAFLDKIFMVSLKNLGAGSLINLSAVEKVLKIKTIIEKRVREVHENFG